MSGILNRTAYFGRLPNGTMRRLDLNLVNTDLGGMIEPNQSVPGLGAGVERNTVSAVNDSPADGLSDNAVTDVQVIREDELSALFDYCHSSPQTPRLY